MRSSSRLMVALVAITLVIASMAFGPPGVHAQSNGIYLNQQAGGYVLVTPTQDFTIGGRSYHANIGVERGARLDTSRFYVKAMVDASPGYDRYGRAITGGSGLFYMMTPMPGDDIGVSVLRL